MEMPLQIPIIIIVIIIISDLLLLGYTGDLTVALEPPECIKPASEDSLQSGEYLPCV